MLTLNSTQWAPHNTVAPDGAAGYYRPRKKRIDLLNLQKELVGVICANGVIGRATKQADGRYWYSYADVPGVGHWESYIKGVDECEAAIKTHCPGAYYVDNRPSRF